MTSSIPFSSLPNCGTDTIKSRHKGRFDNSENCLWCCCTGITVPGIQKIQRHPGENQFLRKTVQRKTASRLATQNSWLSDAMSRSCSVFLFFASRLVALPRVLHQTWSGARSEQPSSAGLAGDHPPRPIIPITDGCCRGRQYTAAPVGTLEPRGVSRTAPCARWGVALSPRTPGSARQCRCPGPRSRSSSVPSRR